MSKKYEFFLSEIFNGEEEELGYIIELMRVASHIKELKKILVLTFPQESVDEFESLKQQIKNESMQILLFNISASHIREALKLFGGLRRTSFYKELIKDFDLRQQDIAKTLEGYADEFTGERGLLYDTLKPLRDITFHYDQKQAKTWAKERIDEEKEEKPEHHSICLDNMDFQLGSEYEEQIYAKFLGVGKDFSLMKAQVQVFEIQEKFIDFVKAMSEVLMRRAKIPACRKPGWYLKYQYGFKSGKGDSGIRM
jgi:hypothetical protein